MGKENTSDFFDRARQLVPSDIIPQLFSNINNLEALKKRGRTPVKMGRMGSLPSGPNRRAGDTWEWEYVYMVPPTSVKSNEIDRVGIDPGGVSVFVCKDGKQLRGLEYRVTEKQAKKIDELIERGK